MVVYIHIKKTFPVSAGSKNLRIYRRFHSLRCAMFAALDLTSYSPWLMILSESS